MLEKIGTVMAVIGVFLLVNGLLLFLLGAG